MKHHMSPPGAGEAAARELAVLADERRALHAVLVAVRKAHPHLTSPDTLLTWNHQQEGAIAHCMAHTHEDGIQNWKIHA